MDKELLSWKNRAAEAERKRVTAVNRAVKLSDQVDKCAKALDEAAAIFRKLKVAQIYDVNGELLSKDSRAKFNKREFAQAERLMRSAGSNIVTPEELHNFTPVEEPPENPETNDHYFDGQYHWWFYLGKWHQERENG